MSRYRFSLHDYHAIKNAVIAIDGITVLSGENGCGKSTLSKWLYYMVNGTENYEKYIYNAFIHAILDKISHLNVVVHDIVRHLKDDRIEKHIYEGQKELRRLLNDESQENVDNALRVYQMILDEFTRALSDYLKRKPSAAAVDRMFRFLDMETGESDNTEAALQKYIAAQAAQLNRNLEKYFKAKDEREVGYFFYLLRSAYRITDDRPVNIQLEEDGVKLLRKGGTEKVGILYNLNRAIYVDTPMSVSEEVASDRKYWEHLLDLMLYPAKDIRPTNEAKKLMMQITRLIKGKVEVQESIFTGTELHYVREDGLDIKLVDVATGYKSFAYLLRLLGNGYLNSSTLLLIDEPEAHLHPQFIVEFARLLVLLNKQLGVKVMIASHNPDMVAAISAIARKEGVADTTHFYVAESSDKDYTYTYRDLGDDIEPIFKSFNIAYERIDQYGSSSL